MRRLFLALVLLLLPCVVQAQTVTRSLEWDMTDSLTLVNTYVETVKIDAAAATIVTPSCATVGTGSHCKTPITLTSGTHVIVITITNAAALSSTGTLNYNPGPAPSSPTNITITVTITVP